MNLILYAVWEEMKQAWRALLSNKVRSTLTMLGVIIGIFSVITLVTIGEGAKTYVTDQIKNMGAGYDSFILVAGKDISSPPNPKFTYADLGHYKSRVPEIRDIVGMNIGTGDLFYGKKVVKGPVVMGITANGLELMGGKMSAGRYFTQAEVEARRKVAVIGPRVAQELFGESSPLGERIKMGGDQYLIIGVTEARGSIGPMDMDRRIVLPVTIVKNMFGNYNIMRFNIFPKDVNKLDEVKEKVREVTLRRLGNDDFRFMTQQGILNIVNNILAALTGFVTGIAAISLLVGGIGIMNIMLVAVNERIREIGVRKAIGAKSRDIVLQFLVESMMISLLGGILGILLGLLGAFLIMFFIKGTLVIAWWAVILATVVSAAVGIFFGVYPAMRAAKLDPVIALRYE
ncbi:MAG: ABC transporter permease [Candidatus Margulisbacteria bacterium]|nr:ABC transporter permease [Candidatus Margulisiibacteriota bacterium]